MAELSKRVRKLVAKAAQQHLEAGEALGQPKRAAGYVRVSGDELLKGYGPEYQADAIESFSRSQGYELLTIMVEDAVTGASDPAERSAFKQLLEGAARRDFDVGIEYYFGKTLGHAVRTKGRHEPILKG